MLTDSTSATIFAVVLITSVEAFAACCGHNRSMQDLLHQINAKDPTLDGRLRQEDAQRQLLCWLIKGAVAWYKQGLGAQPAAMLEEFRDYVEENDSLTTFIATKCVLGDHICAHAGRFRQAYITDGGHTTKQGDLRQAMQRRGYLHCQRRLGGKLVKVYLGLDLASESCESDIDIGL